MFASEISLLSGQDDVVEGVLPPKDDRLLIERVQMSLDASRQLRRGVGPNPAQQRPRELREEDFDQVQPRPMLGREDEFETIRDRRQIRAGLFGEVGGMMSSTRRIVAPAG